MVAAAVAEGPLRRWWTTPAWPGQALRRLPWPTQAARLLPHGSRCGRPRPGAGQHRVRGAAGRIPHSAYLLLYRRARVAAAHAGRARRRRARYAPLLTFRCSTCWCSDGVHPACVLAALAALAAAALPQRRTPAHPSALGLARARRMQRGSTRARACCGPHLCPGCEGSTPHMVGTPTDDGEVELLPGGVDVADDIFGKNLQGGRARARCEDAPAAHRTRTPATRQQQERGGSECTGAHRAAPAGCEKALGTVTRPSMTPFSSALFLDVLLRRPALRSRRAASCIAFRAATSASSCAARATMSSCCVWVHFGPPMLMSTLGIAGGRAPSPRPLERPQKQTETNKSKPQASFFVFPRKVTDRKGGRATRTTWERVADHVRGRR